jgi:hypothetical protein
VKSRCPFEPGPNCCQGPCLGSPGPSCPCKRSDETGWLMLAIVVLMILGGIVVLQVLP